MPGIFQLMKQNTPVLKYFTIERFNNGYWNPIISLLANVNAVEIMAQSNLQRAKTPIIGAHRITFCQQ